MSIYVIAKELFGCVTLVHLSTPALDLVLADDSPQKPAAFIASNIFQVESYH
jgi:hypothetical protein